MAFRRYGLCRPPGIVRNPTGHLYLVIACCTAVVVALLLLNELTRSQGSHASHVAPAAVAVADQGDATKNSEENLVLLIAILSSVTEEGAKRRTAVRESWLRLLPGEAKALFFVGGQDYNSQMGTSIENAMKQHDDLVMLPEVPDTYEGLTDKVLGIAAWANKNKKFEYLLKCDDDTFLRPDIIVPELRSRGSTQPLYMGFMDGRHTPRKHGQWAESQYVLCDHYIVYAKGGAYVLSSNVISYLAANTELLVKFKSEDVSVGTWLAPLNVERLHDPRFDTEYVSRGCDNRFVAMHKQSPDMLRKRYEDLTNLGKQCSSETRLRGSYEYNWKVPPSQCCKRNPKSDSSIP